MILCIDIGNTNISYAIWDNNFSSINRIETEKYKTIFPLKNKIQNIAITSVVPTISDYYKNYLNNEYQIKPFIVNYKNCGINLNVEKKCHELIDLTLARGAKDNVTAILVDIE